MKLILTAEVDHLGVAGDTVEVKDGYGRNYLLPRGLAIAASQGAERQADREQHGRGGEQHQRDIAIAVKNAREVALLPFSSSTR